MASVDVKFDVSALSTICIVLCKETSCKHNLRWKGEAACNLKNITIGREGKCTKYDTGIWY
jgi:hypothetical protein